jgi:NAD(P)-dependent dehydrogenase (short-subunit alcohol dehydrogenase family)
LQPSGGQRPDALPSFGENTPISRPGQPVELASIYVLLASNDASYATGQVYGEVVRVAAGDDPVIRHNFLIDPMRAGCQSA